MIDPLTGEIHEAQVFVATLGASSYSYAEATWTQSLPDWIGQLTPKRHIVQIRNLRLPRVKRE